MPNKEDDLLDMSLEFKLIQDHIAHGLNVVDEVEKYCSVLLATQLHEEEAEIIKKLQETQRAVAEILENSTLGDVTTDGVTNYKKDYDKVINDILHAINKNDKEI